MDAARALNLYVRLVRQADAENGGVKAMALGAFGAANRTDAIGDAVDARVPELLPIINGADQQERFKQVSTLLGAIIGERAGTALTEAEYVGWLIRWNKWFRQKQLKLGVPPIKSADALVILTEIHNASIQKDGGFKAFCLAVPDPHRRIFDMRIAFIKLGLPVMDLYTAMHFMAQNTLPVDALSQHTATDLHYLSTIAPPLTAFGGFAGWGPGNHGTIPANKQMHFQKHVLDAHPSENLPWQGECGLWWQALNISLTRQDAQNKLGAPLFNAVKAHFPADASGRLPFDKVEAVVSAVKSGGGWPQPLLAELVNAYAATYAARAITLSQSMTNIIVHTDADKSAVYVKGLNGQFYLGGRIEAGVLGLSTCFIPKPGVDLVNLHVPRKIWQVSP